MADHENRETERPRRAAKDAAISQIARPKKVTRRNKASSITQAAAQSEAEATVEFPPPELGSQTGCRDFFAAISEYCENSHERFILPERQRQKAAAESLNTSTHPALPRANVGMNDWTAEDEAAVQEMWNAQKNEWELRPGIFQQYTTLFKLCLQFGNCTPWDIVGARTNMRFELDARGPSTAANVNHMWSYSFCNNLSMLVTHSAWPACLPLSLANHLAAAIQYVVILRTGDRRVWDPTFGSNDPFLVWMKHFSRNSDGRKSMQDVHREAREHVLTSGYPLLNFSMSYIFLELEKLITSPAIPRIGRSGYWVRVSDLTTLAHALDNMTASTGFVQLSVKVQYEAAMACRGINYPPSSMEEVQRYHKIAIVEEMRRNLERGNTTAAATNRTLGEPDEAKDAGGNMEWQSASESLQSPELGAVTLSRREGRWELSSFTRADHVFAPENMEVPASFDNRPEFEDPNWGAPARFSKRGRAGGWVEEELLLHGLTVRQRY